MKTPQNFSRFFSLTIAFALVLLSGCAVNAVHEPDVTAPNEETIESQNPISQTSEAIQVIRYGRYTLVEVDTFDGDDVLSQIIDVSFPAASLNKNVTVADALQYVLLTSGYNLCQNPDVKILDSYPLPLIHHRLGPISIKDALLRLAGFGWKMQIDHFNRSVCFVPEAAKAIEVEGDGEENAVAIKIEMKQEDNEVQP